MYPNAGGAVLQQPGRGQWRRGCGYVGSAVITARNPASSLVAVVNQVNPRGAGSTYEAVNPAAADHSAGVALVQSNQATVSGLQVQNLTGQPTVLVISSSPGSPCGPWSKVAQLPASGSFTLVFPGGVPALRGCEFVGSVTVAATRPNARIAVLSNQIVRGNYADPLSSTVAM